MKEEASPVDSGCAWVICIAGCFLHIFVIGSIRSTGILLANVSEHYNRNKRDTSWIMGLMFLTFLLFSPVTMALARRYTVRRVVVLGGIVLCLGFTLSYFAMALEFLYLSIGLLVGLGGSLTHPPTVLLVNFYFDRHRTVAMGITMAGGSAGALCMPALMNWLIDRYTFRGSMLVWGGLMLNVTVAGALMRPFVEAVAPAAAAAAVATEADDEAKERLIADNETTADSRHCRSADNLHCREPGCASLRRATSAASLQHQHQHQHQQDRQKQQQQKVKHNGLHQVMKQLEVAPPKLTLLASSCGDISVLVGQPASVAALAVSPPEGALGSGQQLRPLPQTMAEASAAETTQEATDGRLVGALRSLNLNPHLLRSPRFWFMLAGLALAVQGMPFNLMILPQHGKSLGMPASEYTLLLQYQGITDFLIRIGIGLFADRQLVRRQLLLVALLVGQGGLWCLLLHPTASAALAFSLLEGVLAGGVVTNLAPILVDTFGVNNLPTTYGFLGVIESFIMISVPVLLGDLFDKTGSWNASIIVVAILIASSGLMLLADDLLHQRSKRRSEIRQRAPC